MPINEKQSPISLTPALSELFTYINRDFLAILSKNASLKNYEIAGMLLFENITKNNNTISSLTKNSKEILKRKFIRISKKNSDLPKKEAIAIIAKDCAAALSIMLEKTSFEKKTLSKMELHIAKHLAAHKKNKSTTKEAVLHISNSIMRDIVRKRKKAEMSIANPLLRNNLHTYSNENKIFKKESVATHLKKLAKNQTSVFSNSLKESAPFFSENMKKILGEEIYTLCKPVGYLDRNHKILLVKAKSSAIIHLLNFQKSDILNKIKRVPQFKQVNDIRFSLQ